MPKELPRLFCDNLGIWREDKPGQLFGVKWDEITSICGYKLDGITEVYTVLELGDESGHWQELNAAWPGFDDVTQTITARLPIPSGWLAELDRMNPQQTPVTFWQKSQTSLS